MEFVKSLLGNTVDVSLELALATGNSMKLKLAKTDYMDSGIVNFTDKFYDTLENYIQEKYPEACLRTNNTGSTLWITEGYGYRPDSKLV